MSPWTLTACLKKNKSGTSREAYASDATKRDISPANVLRKQRQGGGGQGNQGNLKARIGALFDELSSEEKAEFFDTIAKKDF